jgi:hypothetical protein
LDLTNKRIIHLPGLDFEILKTVVIPTLTLERTLLIHVVQAITINEVEISGLLLGMWAKQLRKATISLIMSSRPSVPLFTQNSETPTGESFIKVHI